MLTISDDPNVPVASDPLALLRAADSTIAKAFDAYGVDDEPSDGHRTRYLQLVRAIDELALDAGCLRFNQDSKLVSGYPKADIVDVATFWKTWFPALVARRATIWDAVAQDTNPGEADFAQSA